MLLWLMLKQFQQPWHNWLIKQFKLIRLFFVWLVFFKPITPDISKLLMRKCWQRFSQLCLKTCDFWSLPLLLIILWEIQCALPSIVQRIIFWISSQVNNIMFVFKLCLLLKLKTCTGLFTCKADICFTCAR